MWEGHRLNLDWLNIERPTSNDWTSNDPTSKDWTSNVLTSNVLTSNDWTSNDPASNDNVLKRSNDWTSNMTEPRKKHELSHILFNHEYDTARKTVWFITYILYIKLLLVFIWCHNLRLKKYIYFCIKTNINIFNWHMRIYRERIILS
jgi:hypothetical protein